MMSTIDIMDKGMNCLLQNLGTIDTERFIAVLIREKIDYTKWRRSYFGNTSVAELNDEAVAYAQEHPFKAKKEQQPIVR